MVQDIDHGRDVERSIGRLESSVATLVDSHRVILGQLRRLDQDVQTVAATLRVRMTAWRVAGQVGLVLLAGAIGRLI